MSTEPVRLSPQVRFEERQHFTQWWLWLLTVTSALLPTGLFGYALIQQLVFNQPWGHRPMSDTTMVVLGGTVILGGLAALLLLFSCQLRTTVRDDGVFIRFRPIHLRPHRIDIASASKVHALTYRPVLEYGGWGIRYRLHGKAYNVSGNQGVRIDYPDGKHVLIGSQRAEELAQAINALRHPPEA